MTERGWTDTKRCSMCEQTLPLDAFNRQRDGSKGRQSRCRTCHRPAALADYQAKRERYVEQMRNRDLQRHYGITAAEYDVLFARQGGLCACCGQPETAMSNKANRIKRLAVDHCHVTGKVRALLCATCNQGLGQFGDDIERLKQAIAYLERHR